MEHRNTGGTPEHRRDNRTLAKQSEYYRIVEHEKSSGITEQQNNTITIIIIIIVIIINFILIWHK